MIRTPKSNGAPDLLGSAAFLLFRTAVGTTWRMFVPTVGGTIIGITLDHLFATKPYLTIIMLAIGIIISILLVIMQLRSVRKND